MIYSITPETLAMFIRKNSEDTLRLGRYDLVRSVLRAACIAYGNPDKPISMPTNGTEGFNGVHTALLEYADGLEEKNDEKMISALKKMAGILEAQE